MADNADENAPLLEEEQREFNQGPPIPTRIFYYPRTVRVLNRIVLFLSLPAIALLIACIVLSLLTDDRLLGQLSAWAFGLAMASLFAFLNRKSSFPLLVSVLLDFGLVWLGMVVMGELDRYTWPNEYWCRVFDYDREEYLPVEPGCIRKVQVFRGLMYAGVALSVIIWVSQLLLLLITLFSWVRRDFTTVVRTPTGEFSISLSVKFTRFGEPGAAAAGESSALPAESRSNGEGDAA